MPPKKTADLTSSWSEAVEMYLDALEDETFGEEARKKFKSEILRAAELADRYVDLQK